MTAFESPAQPVGFSASWRRHERAFDLALLVVALIALWQAFFEIAGSVALASPWAAAERAVQMLLSPDFWVDVRATFSAFAFSVIIEIALGLTIGATLGLRRMAGDVVEPLIASLYAIPKLMFFPIITLIFGIGLSSEVVFGVLHGIVPVILFTMGAVRNIKPVHLKTGRAMGLTNGQILLTIALPSAIPEIFTGLRIGIAGALIGVILCEMFGSSHGVGFRLMNAMSNNVVPDISALTLLLILVAAVLSGLLIAIDEKLHRRNP